MLFTLQRYEFFSKSQQYLFTWYLFAWCCLPYKGTNFSANHNYCVHGYLSNKMLFTLQRYEFFSKSQQVVSILFILLRCCLPYKGTNFSANHNPYYSRIIDNKDVVYPTKVRIFQQITTKNMIHPVAKKMLFTLQRYEFFSKSQRGWQHFILSPVISKFKPNNFS